MERPLLPNLPTISQILDDFLGEPDPQEMGEEAMKSFKEVSERDGNTIVV